MLMVIFVGTYVGVVFDPNVGGGGGVFIPANGNGCPFASTADARRAIVPNCPNIPVVELFD